MDAPLLSKSKLRTRRLLHVLAIVGETLGALFLFLVAVVGGLLLHLNTGAVRRVVVSELNAVLAPSFKGQIVLERIGGLNLFGLARTDVTIKDPRGVPVLVVRGASVGWMTGVILRSELIDTRSPLDIHLGPISVDSIEANLDTDPQGHLYIADAFDPKTPSPPDPHPRGLRLEIDRVALHHLWAHGDAAGSLPIDVDIDAFQGAMASLPDRFEVNVAGATLFARRLANGADVSGSLAGHFLQPSDPHAAMQAKVDWKGLVGRIANTIQANLENQHVDAEIDAPAIQPADLHAIVEAVTLESPAALHVQAHGPMSNVALLLRASTGPSVFSVDGNASLGNDKRADLRLDLRDADAHRVIASAPRSAISATGEVHALSKADGSLEGSLTLGFPRGEVDGRVLPPIDIAGSGVKAASGDVHARATIDVKEASAPTQITATVAPKAHGDMGLDFTLRSDVASLDDVPALQHQIAGEAHVNARGSFDLKRMEVDAHVEARARRIVAGPTKVDAAALYVAADGPVGDPHVAASVQSEGVVAGGKKLTRADVRVTGKLTGLDVNAQVRSTDVPDVDGALHVAVRPEIAVERVALDLSREGTKARITTKRVAMVGGATRVEGLRIEGLGRPLVADAVMSGQDLHLQASTEGLDLGALGRIVSLEKNLKSGLLVMDANVDVTRAIARGHAKVDVSGASIGTTQNVAVNVDVNLAGRKFSGKVHGEAQGIGALDLDATTIEVAGSNPLLSASVRQIFGTVGIAGKVDVGRASALIPADDVPFNEAGGIVALKGQVHRKDPSDITPDILLDVATKDLVFAPRTARRRDIDGVLVIDPPPWRLSGIDIDLSTHVDGESGKIEAKTRLRDKKGPLLAAELRADRFPYAQLYASSPAFKSTVLDMPFDLTATIPTRGLGSLPNLLKQNYLSGKISGEIAVKGSARVPVVDVRLALDDSHFSQVSNREVLDLSTTLHYDGTRGQLQIKGQHDRKDALDFEVNFEAKAARALAGDAQLPWTASAKAKFSAFPLEAIPLMDEKLVSGLVNGDFTLAGLHRDANAKAALRIDNLKVGSTTYKSAALDLDATGHNLKGRVRIDQNDGFVQTDADATATWGAAIAPALDPEKPVAVNLSSKNFSIGVILPFVEGTMDELDGRIDANAKVELDPRTRRATLSGEVSLSKGLVEAAAGGGEFHDMSAHVRFTPDGTITLDKLTAAGLSGRFQADGVVKLDGTHLQSAKATITIPRNSGIPVSAGGAEIGTLDGRIEVQGSVPDPAKGMDLKVVVPSIRVALPDSSSTNAAGLGPIEGVRVGAHRGRSDSFVLIPLDPSTKVAATEQDEQPSSAMHISTDLHDVQVTRGTDITVNLGGKVDVLSGDKTNVTGKIFLKHGGHLSVQGKNFVIESGTVTFGGDPSNPEIVLKAGYTARDGTIVYANFIGPLKTGKVTLTSEPAYSQEEIVQLLMFGSPDGAQAQNPSADSTVSALSTAGGEAAQPLNHLLNQWGLGAVSVNVDTTDSATPKPEVAIQIARDISLQLAVVLGQPPPGVNPDVTLLTVDWRFASKWSLASTLGDAGTTIFDLLWKKRY
jgi:translocation and assembly module TamB